MLARKLMGGAGAEEKLYVDSVFSTYLYTGNGSTQTITNGIDLAGEGGLVWVRDRGANGTDHALFDTVQGRKVLYSNATNAATSLTAGKDLLTYDSTGFTLGASNSTFTNQSTKTYASWTFRRAPKFFDIVTYTGDGTSNRQIPHSLGVAPGMVIVKATSTTGDWYTWHRSNGTNPYALNLNTTEAGFTSFPSYYGAAPTSSIVTLSSNAGGGSTNQSGANYVAYLFAHDTGTDGIIQCGNYTGNQSSGINITLGWEPQYLMIKRVDTTGNWNVFDTMRGLTVGTTNAPALFPNLSSAESGPLRLSVGATGFYTLDAVADVNINGGTYIYLAIRRPNKPPTSGTEVYNNSTPSSPSTTYTDAGFSPDMVMGRERAATISGSFAVYDRLRGIGPSSRRLRTTSATTEDAWDGITQIGMLGVTRGVDTSMGNGSGILHYFRRAVGFFDEVCFTGAASGDQAISHSLGVAPEWIVICSRTSTAAWYTYTGNVNAYLTISSSDSLQYFTGMWPSTANTSSVFNIKPANVGVASKTAVAYLFATLAGISKVGSYTGNGSSQTINCGFSAGARFILIKRTDSTGDWYIWDSVRGIVAANDPHLSLNTTAAEVTTDDSVDPDASGFIVNQVAATNINVTSATYIYLAIA